MSEHDNVSSEEQFEMESFESDLDMYEDVSNENPDPGLEGDGTLISEGYNGVFEADLEDVEGFDPSMAMAEGEPAEEVKITKEMKNMVDLGAMEFETPESVCGVDNRSRIRNTASSPWRMNCQLLITLANGGQSRCTGWFIGPRTVMTAGHCVYSHAAGGWARRIEVVPGMDGSQRPYGSQVSSRFHSVTGWTRDQSVNHDYGAIILPNNNLGNRVGWYGFTSLSSGDLSNLLVNNSGYPGDKPFGTQWFNAGRITRVNSRRLFYMIDTAGGQSGSAVYRLRNGIRHAVGIHAYGGCPNKAVRITRPVFDRMLSWKNAS